MCRKREIDEMEYRKKEVEKRKRTEVKNEKKKDEKRDGEWNRKIWSPQRETAAWYYREVLLEIHCFAEGRTSTGTIRTQFITRSAHTPYSHVTPVLAQTCGLTCSLCVTPHNAL
jgi:hypothetical protein